MLRPRVAVDVKVIDISNHETERIMRYEEDTRAHIAALERRTDPAAARMQKLLALADLTRTPGSPVYYVTEAIRSVSALDGAEPVEIPEIVSVRRNFDLLGAPAGHPSRSPSDTFYTDDTHVLRTQTTTMWTYVLRDRSMLRRMHEVGELRAYCHGKVYRNDRIDRHHSPVFHQIDGLCVTTSSRRRFTTSDLERILVAIATAIYGEEVRWRCLEDTFPFTEPSRQLEIHWRGEWIEVLGAGLVNPRVLSLLGLDPLRYNGWAFGFGLDRVAMIKMDIPDIRILRSGDERITRQFTGLDSRFRPVSKYPSTDRDISFVVRRDLPLTAFYELVRDYATFEGEEVVEEVSLLDTYADPARFGAGRVSYTFRIRYRSYLRTLSSAEVNAVQQRIRERTATRLEATLR
jgi:phenylalanyl-tRNA synthetase alpha chain